ncbi:MAG: thioredoxin family protein [Endomicrobia bacterium]|nr:thioredoxin family protein [Endomicrobiia bacterium]
MKIIKILATGDCSNCKRIYNLVENKIKEKQLNVKLEKISDINKILEYGVMTTPAVVIDEKLVFAGGLPTQKQLDKWFEE